MAGLNRALATAQRFGTQVQADHEVVEDLQFWVHLSATWNGKGINPSAPDLRFTTDAGPNGWGGWFQPTRAQRLTIQGRFLQLHTLDSTNEKELLAIFYCLRAFTRNYKWRNKHIRVVTDSVNAMLYINKAGGKTKSLVKVTKMIYEFALRHNLQLSAEYISTHDNKIADEASRVFLNPDAEVMIEPACFQQIQDNLGPLDVDLFAAMENSQLPRYVSWRPDPSSMYGDAFSRRAPKGNLYAFPPTGLILRLLAKVKSEARDLVLIAPFWPSQPFWPVLMSMLSDLPMILPFPCLQHPLGLFSKEQEIKQLQLIALSLSGNSAQSTAFQNRLSLTRSKPTSRIAMATMRHWTKLNATSRSTVRTSLWEMIKR
jgi:hypothetical protein